MAPAPKERWTTKIELDIGFDEEILFPVRFLEIHHPYADKIQMDDSFIPVYALEEILTEKIRSFFQRSYKAPRDFYDVWNLLNNVEFDDWEKIKENLKSKCAQKSKEINARLFEDTQVYNTVSKSWHSSIVHHLPANQLPSFEEVWNYLKSNLFTQFLKLK